VYKRQEEEWRVTITGSQGEAVAAEMVAAMYDASLDALHRPHTFPVMSLYPNFRRRTFWQGSNAFANSRFSLMQDDWNKRPRGFSQHTYDQLLGISANLYYRFGYMMDDFSANESMAVGAAPQGRSRSAAAPKLKKAFQPEVAYGGMGDLEGESDEDGIVSTFDMEPAETPALPLAEVPIRTNLNETAFFLPQIRTDEDGHTVLKFTMPEALTRWKVLAFAHTEELQIGSLTDEVVTQ